MATGLKYLRLYLHDDAGERRAIGHLFVGILTFLRLVPAIFRRDQPK